MIPWQALAQKDAAGVIQYGKCFREELKSFAEKFGQVPILELLFVSVC